MLAISLWQPWASLWISGRKRFETRHWPLAERHKTLAVHAAQKLIANLPDELHEICIDEFGCNWNHALPRGCLIGALEIAEVVAITPEFIAGLEPEELACGDFRPGRYAWHGVNQHPWSPISFCGRQSLFTVPPEVMAKARPRLVA